MIIGENPSLLSQVHYIMQAASQSASRPPSTLSSVLHCDSRQESFFLICPPIFCRDSQCQPHTQYMHAPASGASSKIEPPRTNDTRVEVVKENHLERAGCAGQCRSPQQCAYSLFIPPLSGSWSMTAAVSARRCGPTRLPQCEAPRNPVGKVRPVPVAGMVQKQEIGQISRLVK